jgi:outer membrane protein OmpA-like peptidoglycan-associated protein
LNHDDPKLNGCPRARIEGSDIIIMDRIEFDSRSDAIRPDSLEILKAVASLLSEHPEIEGILIEGHTDSIGSRNYNLKLSQLRARAVLKWLEGNNIEKGRLSSSGQGMQTPIDTNETVLGRQNNRRVEFHIVQQGETHE